MANTYQADESPDPRYTLEEFRAKIKFEADSATNHPGITPQSLATYVREHYTNEMLSNLIACVKRNGYMFVPTMTHDVVIPPDVARPIANAEAQYRGSAERA